MKTKLAVLILGLVVLCGCKPPKFDQSITCDSGFSATNVTVYSYDPTRLYVLHPDKTYSVLVGETCQINGKKN